MPENLRGEMSKRCDSAEFESAESESAKSTSGRKKREAAPCSKEKKDKIGER